MTTCNWQEEPFLFSCGDETLLGTACIPAQPSTRGVLIVVGGPQYRVGSHRQFVHLARSLAATGIPCMRFDVRGMGDSTGAMRSFEEIEDDIAAAVTAFLDHCQGLRSVVLWGLCDGASAACFYAHRDSRVTGLVLVNPWVRTTVGQAQTQLRHYYIDRLREAAFWTKLLKGGLAIPAI